MNAIHDIRSAYRHAVPPVVRPRRPAGVQLISQQMRLTTPARLSIESPAFCAGCEIPQRHSADGENLSPPLRWLGVPGETEELLLLCEDPDAPRSEPFIHWMLYGLPAGLRTLPEGVPSMDTLDAIPYARQGKNSTGQLGYLGPMPPAGDEAHHYHFQLFALDRPVRFNFCPYRDDLISAMSGHVLAVGDLVGTFQIK